MGTYHAEGEYQGEDNRVRGPYNADPQRDQQRVEGQQDHIADVETRDGLPHRPRMDACADNDIHVQDTHPKLGHGTLKGFVRTASYTAVDQRDALPSQQVEDGDRFLRKEAF